METLIQRIHVLTLNYADFLNSAMYVIKNPTKNRNFHFYDITFCGYRHVCIFNIVTAHETNMDFKPNPAKNPAFCEKFCKKNDFSKIIHTGICNNTFYFHFFNNKNKIFSKIFFTICDVVKKRHLFL